MNRTVVSGIAAFALLIGAGLAMNQTTAEAGHCGGGLFAKLHAKRCGGGLFAGHGCGGHSLFNKGCGGGLLARLKAKHAARKSCCEPAPADCCEPAPEPCCAPAPEPCCEPAPEPCCEPAPEPCCEPAPEPCCAPAPEPCCEAAPAPCGGCEAAVAAPACDACGGGMMAVSAGTMGIELGEGETLVPGSVQTHSGDDSGELAAPASSSDAEEAAPPAPTPDASTDA